MRKALLIAVAAVVVLAVVLAATGTAPVEKVRTGELFENTDAEIHEVRLLGLITVYVESLHFRGSDVSVAVVLGMLGAALAVVAAFVWTLGGTRGGRLAAFYGLAAAGALFLGADEAVSVHESIGYSLTAMFGTLPGFDRNDDVVFALYAIPAGIFLWVFRDLLLESRRALQLFGAAVAAFVATAAFDALGRGPESAVELLTGLLLLAAFGWLAAHHAGTQLRQAGVQPRSWRP